MNNVYLKLEMIGMMLASKKKVDLTDESNPVLKQVVEMLGIGGLFSSNEEISVEDYLESALSELERTLDYYDASELLVNVPLDMYLSEQLSVVWDEKPHYPELRHVAMTVCALGNKGGETTAGAAVLKYLEEAGRRIATLREDAKRENGPCFQAWHKDVRALMFIEGVLQVVDTFVSSRLGVLAGCEEFAPGYEIDPDDLPEPDFEPEDCAGPANDCDCGCTVDHGLTILEGLEDFLNGEDTSSARYMQAVAFANDIRLSDRAGNEGAIIDGIREMGTKAWESLKAAFDALMSMFNGDKEDEKENQSVSTADTNKKALQAMEDKSLLINDAAKNGVIKLADSAYPDGSMKTIVSSLTTVSSAPRVIDKLLGLLKKESKGGVKLATASDNAKKALDELKSSTNKAGGAKEGDKEAVAAAKAVVAEKTKEARAALSAAKKELSAHKKRVSAINKAISGINPKIFSKAGSTDEPKAGTEKKKKVKGEAE